LIALALAAESLPLLMLVCLLAGLSEANIAIAQSAIADVSAPAQRSRLFGYGYLSSSLAYVIGPLAGGGRRDGRLSPPAPWFGGWCADYPRRDQPWTRRLTRRDAPTSPASGPSSPGGAPA
jgi:MFS family permease